MTKPIYKNPMLLLAQTKRWIKMFSGKSSFHQPQQMNLNLFVDDNWFYPNDLSSKLAWVGFPDENGIPRNKLSNGELFYFPIAISQKALALYDCFLKYNDNDVKSEFLKLANWLNDNKNIDGCWDCWSCSNKGTVSNYSAMAQGEAISVLCRAYVLTKKVDYLNSAKKAFIGLMDESNSIGLKFNDFILFDEVPYGLEKRSIILNGHIFALWGVYDLKRILNDDGQIEYVYRQGIAGLNKLITECSTSYWSLYDTNGGVASPFYHLLHIEQLKAMYEITRDDNYFNVYRRWEGQYNSKFNKYKAILVKLSQKLTQSSYNEFVA